MSRDDDYYELLGIEPGADHDAIKRAWHELVQRWHPDRRGDDVTFIFQRLAAAYEVLSDPVARAAYDRRRGVAEAAPEAAPRRAPGVLIRRLSGPIAALEACGIARRAKDGAIELQLDVEEVRDGGMAVIAMRVLVRDGEETVEDLYSAWLAIRPGVPDGAEITPSAQLPGVVEPVRFRVRAPRDAR
jgi:curved DNA-binding protein CbpA